MEKEIAAAIIRQCQIIPDQAEIIPFKFIKFIQFKKGVL
ncbi:hypothetical protein PMI17_05014 [Pantoea sp. GM01]|nr:hypothetical protein PMI17_05014 [Pantoea sp. GM01]